MNLFCLTKTKIIIINYKRYKNTNLVIIPNGVSFWFWFRNLNKNQTFPEPRFKVAEPVKNPKMDTKKQNYCNLYRHWTIVIFEWFVISCFILAVCMNIFNKNWSVVIFFYSRAKVKMRQNKKNNFYICSFKKGKNFRECSAIIPNAPLSYATDHRKSGFYT